MLPYLYSEKNATVLTVKKSADSKVKNGEDKSRLRDQLLKLNLKLLKLVTTICVQNVKLNN